MAESDDDWIDAGNGQDTVYGGMAATTRFTVAVKRIRSLAAAAMTRSMAMRSTATQIDGGR